MDKDAETARILIAAGTPLELKNKNQLTPLVHAAWFGRTDIALELIKAGADVQAKDNKGNSALLLALNSEHAVIAKALIENGADVDAPGFDDRVTPLMMAVIHDAGELAGLLLKKGCDIGAIRQNEFHDTALSIADEMGSPLASIIRREIQDRAVAEEQRLLAEEIRAITQIGAAMHAGTEKPFAVKTLRLQAATPKLSA
jgi:hypothetical protein